jgi:hypothetical protein
MSNKFIYPILIIIFSILIIYFILTNIKNKKLNNNIESFIGNNSQSLLLKNNIASNTEFTKELVSGSWLTMDSTVSSDMTVNNLFYIYPNGFYDNCNYTNHMGAIIQSIDNTTYEYCAYEYNPVYYITFILNENIVAIPGRNTSYNLHIKFYNNFNNEDLKGLKTPYSRFNNLVAVISVFSGSTLLHKYVSYKIFNNKVDDELSAIIKSGDIFLNDPPPDYDFKTYNVLIGKYNYPANYIQMGFGISNSSILNIISTKYFGAIQFAIQRVYSSPTNNEIITRSSPPITLSVIQSQNIPTSIIVVPFKDDQTTNNLEHLFQPKATILYFYKLTGVDTEFNYANPNLITTSSSAFQLKNNANNMYSTSVTYNNLNTVQQINNSIYEMTLVQRINSTLLESTTFDFSVLYNLL